MPPRRPDRAARAAIERAGFPLVPPGASRNLIVFAATAHDVFSLAPALSRAVLRSEDDLLAGQGGWHQNGGPK